jgi:hypothetical protein
MTTSVFAAGLAGAALLLAPALARAQSGFADPPGYGEPPPPHDDAPQPDLPGFEPFESDRSTFRLSTGPALRATSERADGGFGAAFDIGAKAAGARFTGTWVGVGSHHGLSQYDAQLWLDFGQGQRLHPILAAGAGLARLEFADASSKTHNATIGVGTLRGSLEYVLPIQETDARAGLDVEGALPAIRGEDAPEIGGWVLVSARVGIGF